MASLRDQKGNRRCSLAIVSDLLRKKAVAGAAAAREAGRHAGSEDSAPGVTQTSYGPGSLPAPPPCTGRGDRTQAIAHQAGRGSLMRKLSMTRSAISLLGCSTLALCAATPRARADQPLLLPNSLVISSSTYDRTQGAVASLTVGTQLANTATSTTQAIAD